MYTGQRQGQPHNRENKVASPCFKLRSNACVNHSSGGSSGGSSEGSSVGSSEGSSGGSSGSNNNKKKEEGIKPKPRSTMKKKEPQPHLRSKLLECHDSFCAWYQLKARGFSQLPRLLGDCLTHTSCICCWPLQSL